MKLLTVFIYGLTLIMIAAGAVLSPLRPYESFLYAVVVTSPAWFVVYLLSLRWLSDLRRASVRANDKMRTQFQFMAFVFPFALAATCASLYVIANREMDHSRAQTLIVPIQGAYVKSHKGSKNYFVRFASFAPPPLKLSIEDSDYVGLRSDDYERARASQKIEIYRHDGALGLPWVEDFHYRLIGSYVSPALKEACAWTRNFDFKKEIPEVKPDSFHEDFWPGGEVRSKEPLVKGVTHGLAHYTFANGRVYGEIPWKDGHKHGVFTLFREDGSKDQTLSYKDGHLYGVSTWYDPAGRATKSLLYVDDQTAYDASSCD